MTWEDPTPKPAAVIAARVTLALLYAITVVGGAVWCAIDTGVWWQGLLFGLGTTLGPVILIGLISIAAGSL